MSADLQLVQQKLDSFRKNIEKLQYQIAISENTAAINQTKTLCKKESEQLIVKFKQGRFLQSENMTVQVLHKEFSKQSKLYAEAMEQLKHHVQQEQKELEMQYTVAYERRKTQIEQHYEAQTKPKKNQVQDEDDVEEPDLELLQEMEAHPDVEHNLMLIQEKNEEIAEIQQEVEATYKIMGDVAKLVFDQGKQLDKAEDNINKANENVKEVVKELDGAKVEHQAYLKKAAGFFCVVIIIVMIVLLVVL